VSKNTRSLTHPTLEEIEERHRKRAEDWDRTLREGKAEKQRQEELSEIPPLPSPPPVRPFWEDAEFKDRVKAICEQRPREPQPEPPPEPAPAPESPQPELAPPEPAASPKPPKRVTRQQRVIAFILKDLFPPSGLPPNDADRGLVVDQIEARWDETCRKLRFNKNLLKCPQRRTIEEHIP
jgi:hypothetical protein